jgi:hypothetical protein
MTQILFWIVVAHLAAPTSRAIQKPDGNAFNDRRPLKASTRDAAHAQLCASVLASARRQAKDRCGPQCRYVQNLGDSGLTNASALHHSA